MHDCVIIGGVIVGLSTAVAVGKKFPKAKIVVLEKETELAQHQTGRNSGVIHSGIYYKPGSYKAKFAKAGATSMVEFCKEHGIKHEVCGKVIVATNEKQLPQLEKLYQRGLENQLPVTKLKPEQVREIEPHVKCLAGIKVPTTGITDYKQVCAKYAEMVRKQDGEVINGAEVLHIHSSDGTHRVETTKGDFTARFLINCAGLHSDRVAKLAGHLPQAKIVPFRGEYYELTPERRHLVRTLIYPVPNPDFPFLGVHFTKMIDGSVHAGPNAVLAFKREGYYKTDFSLADTFETFTYSGFWKLAKKNLGEGMMEMRRSISKKLFVRSLQELIPEVTEADVIPCKAGIRAQALLPNGGMVDDFLFVNTRRTINVCNAPSPAATSAIPIGAHIVEKVQAQVA